MSAIFEDNLGTFWAIGTPAEKPIAISRKLPTTVTHVAVCLDPHDLIMAAAKLIADKVTEEGK
jgi:hypothetical protein